MRKSAVVAICVMFAAPVQATEERAWLSFETGNQLYTDCQTKPPNYCMGYIMGVIDSLIVFDYFCLPERATQGQLRDVVVKYLDEHPAERHQRGDGLVLTAIKMAFPCPAKP